MKKNNCKDCSQNDCAYFGMNNLTTCKDFTCKKKQVWLTIEEWAVMCEANNMLVDEDLLADINNKLTEKYS